MIVTVTVTDGFTSESVSEEVCDFLFRVAGQRLDLPSPDADGFDKMLCSDTVTIEAVMNDRKHLTNTLSHSIARLLMKKFEAYDTVMGYSVRK